MNLPRIIPLALLITAPATAQTNVFPTDGNVGIGTTSPTHKLTIADTNGTYEIGSNGAYWSGFKTNAPAGFFGFQQNERMFMGLGGNVYNRGFSANAMGIFNGSTTAEDIYLFNRNNPDADVLVLKASGNVGIGTTNPQNKLSVYGEGNPALEISAGNVPHILLKNGYGGVALFDVYNDNTLRIGTELNSGTQQFVLAHGNIGMGTATPQAKLDVRGSVIAATPDFVNGSSGSFLQIQQAAGSGNTYSDIGAFSNGGQAWNNLILQRGGGNVGIGTTTPTAKLEVNGNIIAKEIECKSTIAANAIKTRSIQTELIAANEIRANDLQLKPTAWADHVLAPDYALPSLASVETHIADKGHLPGIPSARDVVANGISLAQMQAALLAKIEELTLHQIAQEKELNALRSENTALQGRVQQLEVR